MKSAESYCVPWSDRSFSSMPEQMPFSMLPNCCFTAARTGSIAANRFPFLAVCQLKISSLKCSITPKNQHQPSLPAKNFFPSVAHIRFGASVAIFPSCLRFRPPRAGLLALRRLFSRISPFTRCLAILCPFLASFRAIFW